MGRKRKKHAFRKESSAAGVVQDQDRRRGYSDIIKENEKFEKYYKAQGIVPDEEWDLFMKTLRENLPASFRITGYKGQAKALLNIITGKYFDGLLKSRGDGVDACRPFSLPWYPENLAWQMNLSRTVIRTSEDLQHLHNFLISETETGNISRQETVSMIPPILLNVEPHHKVLDMCAAPGSKTVQLIEFLHRDDGKIPDGLVVANDVDNKRCYMLVHQAKRLNSPCVVITNQDASYMPELKTIENGKTVNIKYDRILCDVPCSGDGTMRKVPDIWQKWNIGNANGLHSLQLRIVKRGLELLALHGRMVYSTCSLNPVEDEAVISALLQMSGDSAKLVDVSESLPGLKRCPGLSQWKIANKDMMFYDKFEEVSEKYHRQLRPSMFPPCPESSKELHLERCFRILPHHQDTGGFFVAVIEKTKDRLPWEPEKDSCDSKENSRSPPRKKQKIFGYKEDPFIFLDSDDKDWPHIRDFYEFQDFNHLQLLCRCQESKKRNIYFVSESVKNIIQNNLDKVKNFVILGCAKCGTRKGKVSMKGEYTERVGEMVKHMIINTGVRMFCRSENKDAICPFRLTQDGVTTALLFLSKRKIHIQKEDLVLSLTNEYTANSQFSQSMQEQLENIESGCVILIYTGNKGMEDEFTIEICGWKGKLTLRCYVPKQERAHYLRICGVDVTDYEKREKKRFKIKSEGEPTQTASEEVKMGEEDCEDEVRGEDEVCETSCEDRALSHTDEEAKTTVS